MKFDPLRFARPSNRIPREERDQLIAEAAYLKAAERHFAPGHEVADWLAAEMEVDERLERRKRQI